MDCPYIPDRKLGDLSYKLLEKVGRNRIPIAGSIELTFRCNLRCQHCYVSHGHNGMPGKQELSLAEIKRIFDQIAEGGTLWLLITGGEPFMRRDFKEIYLYAKQKGFLITLFTNGTLITPRMADFFAEYRPYKIDITLYGYRKETYENVTGIPGSYEKCYRGIELLHERGIPLGLKTMLMTLTQDELWDMKQYAEELGVRFRYDAMINAGLERDLEPVSFRLAPEDIIQIELQDQPLVDEMREYFDLRKDIKVDPHQLYVCSAGLRSFHIDPYGKLSLCMMAREQEYDLLSGSFKRGWDDFLAQVRTQKTENERECNSCSLISICGQCPGWSYIEHGDEYTKVDYLCQMTHLRAEKFGFIHL